MKNKLWLKDNRLTFVVPQEESVLMISLDPVKGEMVKILIPWDLEVEVAGNLGKRKIGNVWKLGLQENDHSLLARTVTSYLETPIVAWIDPMGINLIDGNFLSIPGTVFQSYLTNLNFKDRLSVMAFAKSLDNIDKSTIDLKSSGMIKKSVLSDGSEGYVLSGFDSSKINSLFSDYYFVKDTPRISMVSTPNLKNTGKDIGRILEVMGGKVVSLEVTSNAVDFYCQVSPKDDRRALRISAIFGCDLIENKFDLNEEIQIKLGNKFVL